MSLLQKSALVLLAGHLKSHPLFLTALIKAQNLLQSAFNMSDLEYVGKVKGMKTMKQHEQERLLKSAVMPASELAKRKQEAQDRAKAFTRAAADEEFVNRTERSVGPNCPTPIGQRVGVITREPFEEQP